MTGTRVVGTVMIVLGFIGLIAGLIVGNLPYSEQGIQYCGGWFSSLGGQTIGQSFIDGLSGGACTAYAQRMGLFTLLILAVSVVVLIVGLILIAAGKRRRQSYAIVPPAVASTAEQKTAAAGWYPDYETPGRQRWWDGVNWTQHVHETTVASSNASGTEAG